MKIHFVGIGGIGVSALAKYYLAKGWEVSGCDLVSSEITEQLKNMGAKIRIGPPKKSCVPANVATIVYSPAVPKTNPEIQKSKSKIQKLSYPEALGELTKTHYTIAVSGTHGKSTTTAMIGLLLAKAGLDPTVIVGTKLKEFGDSNCRVGKSKYLVIEADEHFASFLNYWPKMIVLTTVEADHLDYWKTLQNLLRGFQKYISHLPQNGVLVANGEDPNIKKILNSVNITVVKNTLLFSRKQNEAKLLRKVLKIPGEHNVSNALAALTVARVLGIPDKISFRALGAYRGSWRRFEIFDSKIKNLKFKIVSDYGHHPTEIKVTVEAARSKWPFDAAQGKPELWLVFQPHQYARTYYLWDDFVKVLSNLSVDKLIITDIYDVAGREGKRIKKLVSSAKLVKVITSEYKGDRHDIPILYIPTIRQVREYLVNNLRGGEVVMVMGAGDIYNLTLRLRSGYTKRT